MTPAERERFRNVAALMDLLRDLENAVSHGMRVIPRHDAHRYLVMLRAVDDHALKLVRGIKG